MFSLVLRSDIRCCQRLQAWPTLYDINFNGYMCQEPAPLLVLLFLNIITQYQNFSHLKNHDEETAILSCPVKTS
jgi:hypothetical protein